MPTATLFDRYGRRIRIGRVIPDGATLHVPTMLIDHAHRAHVRRTFGDGVLTRPDGRRRRPFGDDFAATNWRETS